MQNKMQTEKKDVAVEMLEQFRKAQAVEQPERVIWDRCFKYVNNRVDGELGQWETLVKQELGGRPALSFPEIKKFVNRISGAQRNTKLEEKAFPVDDVADPVTADIITDLVKHVYRMNRADGEISKQFRSGVICSRGWVKVRWDTENDPLGDISIRYVNPRCVYLLGKGERYDLTDRIGVIEKVQISKDELKSRYPDQYDSIISQKAESDDTPVAGDDYDFTLESSDYYDEKDNEYFLLRRQRWEYVAVRFIMLPDGKRQDVSPEVKDSELPVPPKKQWVRKVRVTEVCGKVVLKDEISEDKHGMFDIVPYFAFFDDGLTTGIVQDLIDSQDEKNKRRSQITHILGVVSKGNILVRKGVFESVDSVKNQLGGTGEIIEVNTTGDLQKEVSPLRPDLTLFPALVSLDQLASQEMKATSGLEDASLGKIPQGARSGTAIQQLQLPTEAIVGEMVENYLSTRYMIAKIVISLIQQYYNQERRFRILGDYTRDFVPPEVQEMYDALVKQIMTQRPDLGEQGAAQIATQMIDLQSGAKVITINKMVGEKRLNDVTAGKYDIAIDHTSQSPTTRQKLLYDLLNMRSMGIPIPDEVIIDHSDIKNKQKVMNAVRDEQVKLVQQAIQEQMTKTTPRVASPQGGGELQNVGGVQAPMI